jgi:hypothetical protein
VRHGLSDLGLVGGGQQLCDRDADLVGLDEEAVVAVGARTST